MHVEVIDCPNNECRKSTLTFCINTTAYARAGFDEGSVAHAIDFLTFQRKWTLIPPSAAKSFPDYVPKAVRDDYTEACVIRDLSPKASATLARRCLQGMIRDFHGVAKGKLIDEIYGIKEKVDPAVWQAIDGIREFGNIIDAHMEKGCQCNHRRRSG